MGDLCASCARRHTDEAKIMLLVLLAHVGHTVFCVPCVHLTQMLSGYCLGFVLASVLCAICECAVVTIFAVHTYLKTCECLDALPGNPCAPFYSALVGSTVLASYRAFWKRARAWLSSLIQSPGKKKLILVTTRSCLSTCVSSVAKTRPSASGVTIKTLSQIAAPEQLDVHSIS